MKLNVRHPTPNAQRRTRTAPVALTIAGSDSSAGAGIQADLKTFSALGVYGLTAVTCVVAEIPGKVSRIEPVNTEIVREQIAVLSRNFPIAAAKTGLLYSAEIVETVARALVDLSANSAKRFPLVIDPVIVATSGDQLLEPKAIELYEKELFPLATLLTPNLDEAEKLVGEPIRDLKAMRKAGKELQQKYRVSILLKGGHLAGGDAVDLLFADEKIREFSSPFIRGVATHGTGCTYSAAIAAGIASGLPLEDAIGRAKKFVTASIAQHFRWMSSSRKNLDALNHSPRAN
ncbi:MAG: bifunctional hydroxymethylpyrimidine kinase/phosphomethylpyrimidine kinase [Verrucomicrobia bacterium]|nr:MAG: bifunctional hydroxymethylpyrimidine kinase/phosphomethylpyrimidine kinase [Verrucomicrobiota bacterium]